MTNHLQPAGRQTASPASGAPEAKSTGIIVEKSQRDPRKQTWFWLRGDTYPHREQLKRYGCRWSQRQQAWYFIGDALPDAVQQLLDRQKPPAKVSIDDDPPCSDKETERILSVRLAPKLTVLPTSSQKIQSDTAHDGDEPPAEITSDHPVVLPAADAVSPEEPATNQFIRIYQPQSMPENDTSLDDIQTAIVQAKTHPAPVLRSAPAAATGKRPLAGIGQAFVGELTGSITGQVYCYGYALFEGTCVYCNFGGPRMAVEAIRARFSKGEIVNCVPWDAPAIELTAGEGNTGMYTAYMQYLPEAKFASVILCHEWLVNPNYGGKSTTFILRTDEAQAMAKLKHHITELVKVSVFDEWASYLYHAGQSAMLVRPTRSAGDIDLLSIDLDIDAWTRLITGGLEQGVITLTSTP